MKLSSHLYEEAVRIYTSIVERDSPDAATAIHQLRSTFGTRAALRAVLIIQLLRKEICQENYPYRISYHSFLLQDYPEVVPLLEQAIAECLCVWGVHDLDVQLQAELRR